MFVTLSEYKKRCDAVLKIAQIISKAYDKDRFKKILENKVEKEINDNILKVLNDYRKENNISNIDKKELKNLIVNNINWKYFWCNINGLKELMKKHADYCLKYHYFDLLETALDYGFDGSDENGQPWEEILAYNSKVDELEKEKKTNPKKYYSVERGKSIEEAVKRLIYDPYEGADFLQYFVTQFGTDADDLNGPNFYKEIYGVKHYNYAKEEIKVEKKLFSKKYYPPNFYFLIVYNAFEEGIFDKVYEGLKAMEKYGVTFTGVSGNSEGVQLQMIDWVADSNIYKAK